LGNEEVAFVRVAHLEGDRLVVFYHLGASEIWADKRGWPLVRGAFRAPTTFKLEGEVASLSGSSQGEVGDNREKWGDFWDKLIAINQNIVSRPL
jgi:hypothetical protein